MVERNSGVLATKDEVRFSIFFFLVRSKRLLNGVYERKMTNRYWVYYYY